MGILDAIRAIRADGWQNVILGLGGTKDPSAYTTYAGRAPLTEDLLEALYVGDHFAAKVVEALPQHALRPGWDLVVPGDPTQAAAIRTAYAAREDELEIAAELSQGWCWGRVFGGAVTWIGADDGLDPALPLDESRIESVRFLHTFDRRDVVIARHYQDPRNPKFRRPEQFRITPSLQGGFLGSGMVQGGGIIVHESRCVVWGGQPTTDRRRQDLLGWDDSVLERCWDALSQLAEDYSAKSLLLGRISQAVYKIKGLYAMLAGKQEDMLQRRMSLLDASRSRARAILLDTEEAFENHTQPVSGVPDAINASVLRLAAAADMPVTILMGQSPAGMDATGESDLEIWNAHLEAGRSLYLRRRHERITRLLLLAKDGPTGGKEPDRWTVTYRPLRIPKARETAELRKLTAEADALNIDKGVYPAEAAAFRYSATGIGEVVLDEQELRERMERRRELAKQPPKDNAELGTVGPRTQAVVLILEKVGDGRISRESGRAILTQVHRYTDEEAEALLGPQGFVAAPAEPAETPGPEPEPEEGQAAGAPPVGAEVP